MTGTAIFSPDKLYRYRLTRTWGRTGTFLTWILCNPSTADAEKNDATMRRCIGFSMNAGYGGMVVLNMWAYRSTIKNALIAAADPVGPENDKYILEATKDAQMVVCAWGVPHWRLRDRHYQVLQLIADRNVALLKITASGFPEHPLYLPANLKPRPWKRAEWEAACKDRP